MIKDIINKLNLIIPNPVCELDYNKDYELLIATMLSAQSTDKRVNIVTKELFKYSLEELSKLDNLVIENIIKSVGTFKRKTIYIKEISKRLIIDHNGIVPNDFNYLETLPGIGHKTASVVLSNIYDIPTIAVDTHVLRVCKILNIDKSGNVIKVEKKLKKIIPKNSWNRVNDQLVLFGRHYCKAKKPICDTCPFNNNCSHKKTP